MRECERDEMEERSVTEGMRRGGMWEKEAKKRREEITLNQSYAIPACIIIFSVYLTIM